MKIRKWSFRRYSLVALLAISAGFLTPTTYAASGKDNTHAVGERSIFSERALSERLAPSAKVCMEGEACQGAGGAATAPVQVAAAEQTPEQIYQTKCMMCHASGAAGAPKLGDEAAWKARSEKGIDTLLKNALSGINAMPAKGLCMECSDELIKSTIEYIISNSVKSK